MSIKIKAKIEHNSQKGTKQLKMKERVAKKKKRKKIGKEKDKDKK